MFERMARSWTLVKASASILMKDQSLLVFPLISGIAVVMVMATFILPLGGFDALHQLSGDDGKPMSAAQYRDRLRVLSLPVLRNFLFQYSAGRRRHAAARW